MMKSQRIHWPFYMLLILLLIPDIIFAQPEVQKARQEQINNELYFNQVSKDIYMITHYFPFYGGNSLFVVLEDSKGVLVDTPYDGIATEALLQWIKSVFGDIALTAMVTGFHQDNLGGNEILIERNIPVYGMSLTSYLLETEGKEFKEIIKESVRGLENKTYLERYDQLQLTAPDHTFDLQKNESMIIEIGTEKFEFFYPGESHTVDNAVVYIPGKKILFGGCMVRAMKDKRPGYIKYANMKEWPLSVELVKEKFPEAEIVIPGHGFKGDYHLLQHTVEIINEWNKTNVVE